MFVQTSGPTLCMILSFFEVGASTVSSEIWSEFSTVLSSSSSRERLDSEELGVAETAKISQLFSCASQKPKALQFSTEDHLHVCTE